MPVTPDEAVRVAWVVWLISWLAAAMWSSPTERRAEAQQEILYRVVTAIGAILLFGLHPNWPWADAPLWQPGPAVGWMLVLVTLCGFAVTWWARITLGRLWSSGVARKADHAIVMAGPYRLVRHPIYTGILLSVFATAAVRATLAAGLGASAIAVGVFIKARLEEGFLRRELGSERYDSYARRVPMLVPFMR